MQSIIFIIHIKETKYNANLEVSLRARKVLLLVDEKENGKENVKNEERSVIQFRFDQTRNRLVSERYSRHVFPFYVWIRWLDSKVRFYRQYRPIIRLFKWMYSPWKIEKSICLSAMKAPYIKISRMCSTCIVDTLHKYLK